MFLERGEWEPVLEDLPLLRETRRWFDIILSFDCRHTGFEIRGADAKKESGFHLRRVLALGLDIGANTAIFSFVYGLLLHPLAFRDLNHLALVWETVPDSGDRSGVSPANFFDWDRQNHVFERMTFYRSWDTAVTAAGESERVDACQVSQEFFRVLEVKAALGRTFLAEEHEPGRDQVVVTRARSAFWAAAVPKHITHCAKALEATIGTSAAIRFIAPSCSCSAVSPA